MTENPNNQLNAELLFKIAVTLLPDIGPVLSKRLIAYVGSPEAVFRESKVKLEKIPGIGRHLASRVKSPDILKKAEEEIQFLEKYHVKYSYYLDKNYPQRLKQCEDGPILFYYKGIDCWTASKTLAMVGTRNATDYGREFCEFFLSELSKRHPGITIISGLAYGIDVTAHRAALKNGLQTIGVLGHGLNTIYPPLHAKIAREMIDQGALVTEFISSAKPDRNNFVKRNRIIAGLSDATLVVESAKTGGALITADIADSYHREVFALPGRTGDNFSKGCNFLIKKNKAALLESVDDLEYLMGWDLEKEKLPQQKSLVFELTPEENILARIMRNQEAMTLDFISVHTGIPVNKVSALLLTLEFNGQVKNLPGKQFKWIGA